MLKALKQTAIVWMTALFVAAAIVPQTRQAFSQATLLPNASQQYLDDDGNPVANGTIDYYIPGTTTRKNTWQDAAQTQLNTNPVILNAGGHPPASPSGNSGTYGSGSYRQVLKKFDGTTVWDRITASTDGGGNVTTVGDGDLVGTMKNWAGMIAPAQYMFAAGQAVSRTTYPDLMTAITLNQNVVCTSGSPTLTGVSDTTQLRTGANIEANCLPPGVTVVSVTSNTVTMSTNATASAATTARFFVWGNGNGSTSFNLPDMRGRVIAGRDNMNAPTTAAAGRLTTSVFGTNPDATGATGGQQSVSLILPNLPLYTPTGRIAITDPGHTHTYNAPNVVSGVGGGGGTFVNGIVGGTTASSATGVTAALVGTPIGGTFVAASATVGAAGSGYTNGSQVITITGGTCTTAPQFTVTVVGNAITAPVLLTAGSCTVVPTNPASFTGAGAGTGGSINVTYTNTQTPVSVIQPTITSNVIIKVTPDVSSAVASGVASIQGMTGVLTCGSGIICTGNVISAISPVLSIDATNVTYTVPLAGGVQQSQSDYNQKTVYITDFGASTVTVDNTALIQAAIDSLPVTGGTVVVPSGTYTISSALNLAGTANNKSFISIVGSGEGSELKFNTASGNANNMINVMSGNGHAIRNLKLTGDRLNGGVPVRGPTRGFWVTGANYSVGDTVEVSSTDTATTTVAASNLVYRATTGGVAGATFIGDIARWVITSDANFNTVDLSYATKNGIYVSGASNVEISGNYIQLFTYAGINIGSGPVQPANIGAAATHTKVTNNAIIANENGMAGGKWIDSIVDGNTVRDNTIYGIVIDTQSSANILSNNNIVSATTALNGIFIYNNAYVNVSNNMIRGWTNGIVTDNASVRLSINGNQILSAGNVGIYLRGAFYSTIGDNVVQASVSHGINIDSSVGITINANTVDGNAGIGIFANSSSAVSTNDNIASLNGAGGIRFTTVSSGTISSNTVFDNTGVGITGIDTTNVALSGNRSYDTRAGGSKTQTYGATTTGTSAGWVIGLNDLSGNLTGDSSYVGSNSNGALLESPIFTGTPAAPTATPGTNTTQIATTAFAAALGATLQPLDSDLTALASNSTNGLWARTGSGTGAARTVTGVANETVITNGDGVSGNPTIGLASNVTGAWTAYVPTLSCNTGTLTSASATGRSRLVGKTLDWSMTISITTNGTCAGYILATLPVTLRAANNCSVMGAETAVAFTQIAAHNSTTTQMLLTFLGGAYPGANGSSISINGTCEAN